ncbi:MAG: MATE family efflux transporter [Myxococcales bacterium]
MFAESPSAIEQASPKSSPLRTLLTLAWPVVIARATQSVIGFSDAFLVAPLGEDALAAVTTSALNTMAFIILPMGTAFIVQSFAAQLRGRGDLAAVDRYAYYGLMLAAAAGLFALLCTPFIPSLLRSFGYTPQVHSLMSQYLMIRLTSVAPAVGMEALGNWYGGLGETRPAMFAGLFAMVTNVAGAYLLIQPHFGLPGYGVVGAAWVSSFATWSAFCVLLLRFWRDRRKAAKKEPFTFRRAEFLRMLRFGVPNGVNWFLEFSAFVLFINLVVGHLGTTVLAAFNVVIQINSISFMPAFGLSSAGAILVGEAIGRRAHDEVPPIVKLTAKLTCGFMGSIGLIYLLFSKQLMGLFVPRGADSGELAAIGATMLMLSAVWQLFDALGLTLGEALRGAGDTTWCMVVRIMLAWFVFTPLGWAAVIVYGGGVHAVIAAMVVYLGALSVAFSLRFASGRWRNIDLVGEPSVI